MSGVFWVSSSQSLLVSRRAGHPDCFQFLDRTRRCPLDVSDPRRSGNQACNVGKNLGKGLVCGDEDIDVEQMARMEFISRVAVAHLVCELEVVCEARCPVQGHARCVHVPKPEVSGLALVGKCLWL